MLFVCDAVNLHLYEDGDLGTATITRCRRSMLTSR